MLRSLTVTAAFLGALTFTACGTSDSAGFGDRDASLPRFDFGDGGDAAAPCKNLECKQVTCPSGQETTVTGTVFAPNGTLPIYNAIVYVPNGTVQPQAKGATCDKCGTVASGSPLVVALTDSSGKFKLDKVPVGQNIPLVIQLGKWRRQVVIPDVSKCVETRLTDPNMTRLPKNQAEGDMPKIAITTGECDQLGCMLPKLGIDKNELGVEADGDTKAVHVYASGGPALPGATTAMAFWSDVGKLKKYDVAVLSCECSENNPISKDALSYKSVTDYLSLGGRIFTTDLQYTWYRESPDPALASISDITGGAPFAGTSMYVDDTFPKGKALADWLKGNFPASTYGEVRTTAVYDNFKKPVDKTKAQTWAWGAPGRAGNTRVFTVNTPVGVKAEDQCGKAVHIDAHVNQADQFPVSCGSPLIQAEAMFAFFFFDLSSCIQKEDKEPLPPLK